MQVAYLVPGLASVHPSESNLNVAFPNDGTFLADKLEDSAKAYQWIDSSIWKSRIASQLCVLGQISEGYDRSDNLIVLINFPACREILVYFYYDYQSFLPYSV